MRVRQTTSAVTARLRSVGRSKARTRSNGYGAVLHARDPMTAAEIAERADCSDESALTRALLSSPWKISDACDSLNQNSTVYENVAT